MMDDSKKWLENLREINRRQALADRYKSQRDKDRDYWSGRSKQLWLEQQRKRGPDRLDGSSCPIGSVALDQLDQSDPQVGSQVTVRGTGPYTVTAIWPGIDGQFGCVSITPNITINLESD